MSSEEFASSDAWLTELLIPHAAEIRERSLVVHSELDPHFRMRCEAGLEAALGCLFRLVFSTLPDGCEVYLASRRSIAAVSPLGSGMLTLRWQVAGEVRRMAPGKATAIHPIAGGAAFHEQSNSAAELERAFRGAGWTLEIEAMNGDRELWVRASTS